MYGIHRYHNFLYVVRDSMPYVEVYDAQGSFSHLMNWTVPGMQGPYDMVGSDFQNLVITDWYDAANITVVSTKVENTVWKFSIGEPFTVVRLAEINNEDYILVTCSATQKIKVFSKSGNLLYEVSIPQIYQPRHSIKIGEGYAVCHGWGTDQLHRVCLISSTGQIQVRPIAILLG